MPPVSPEVLGGPHRRASGATAAARGPRAPRRGREEREVEPSTVSFNAAASACEKQGKWQKAATLLDHAMAHGQSRVPWVLASRGIAAGQLGDADAALDFAFEAHELQPLNPRAIAALIATLPPEQNTARADLRAKLNSLLAA